MTGKQRKTLLTSATLYADGVLSHVENPDLKKLEAEIETTLNEAREAANHQQLLPKPTEADKQQREEFMDVNGDDSSRCRQPDREKTGF